MSYDRAIESQDTSCGSVAIGMRSLCVCRVDLRYFKGSAQFFVKSGVSPIFIKQTLYDVARLRPLAGRHPRDAADCVFFLRQSALNLIMDHKNQVCAVYLAARLQCFPVQRFRLAVAALVLVETGQVVEAA
jgi:hypothetical protein